MTQGIDALGQPFRMSRSVSVEAKNGQIHMVKSCWLGDEELSEEDGSTIA